MGWMSKGTLGFAVAIVLLMLCCGSDRAYAQSPTPTFGGNCCSEHPGPGCENSACTECVCDLDILCCDAEGGWDRICVASASDPERCAGVCPCVSPTPTPGGDCCSVHAGTSCDVAACVACVCGADPVCCNTVWDATCVVRASDECQTSCDCEALPTATPTPTPTPGGDCCAVHAGPQCNDSRCEECVCDLDSQCCDGAWDQRCVDEANVECAAECLCEAAGNCCESHEGVGCNDMRCQDCVCGLDDRCCNEEVGWDQICADQAFAECAVDCLCEPAGNCCVANLGLGCDVQSCQDCVCDIDSACCTDEWDQRCVDEANVECAADCFCDMASCCEAHEPLGCDEQTCQDCVCALDPTCCTEVWDDRCVSEAVEECDNRCSCGPDATPTPTRTPTPGGDCCSPHAGAQCDDSACEACVCDVDSTCCDTVWDATCVDIASNGDDCAESCPCVSDCCFERDEGMCEDQICEDCVCDEDPFCCSTLWDSGCIDIASEPELCAFSCTCLPYCPGDCGFDGVVSIADLIESVNILLGNDPLELCPTLDTTRDGSVTVDEVVQALNAALEDCFL